MVLYIREYIAANGNIWQRLGSAAVSGSLTSPPLSAMGRERDPFVILTYRR
jgi:hypothetical protein